MMPFDLDKTQGGLQQRQRSGCALTTLRESYALAPASSSSVAAFLIA